MREPNKRKSSIVRVFILYKFLENMNFINGCFMGISEKKWEYNENKKEMRKSFKKKWDELM